MPLWLLGPMVLVGVVLVVGASWGLGWSAPARLDEATARARFAVDHPEADVLDVAVSADGASALLWLGTEAALVFVVGDRFATRMLRSARVQARPDGVDLVFADLATPPVRVAVDPDPWRERLGA